MRENTVTPSPHEGVADLGGRGPEPGHRAAGHGQDVGGGQEEAVVTLVRELDEVDPLDPGRALGPVVSAAGRRVLDAGGATDLEFTGRKPLKLGWVHRFAV